MHNDQNQKVAPLVGEWIEIPALPDSRRILSVAPLVGEWIEIFVVLIQPHIPHSVAPLVGEWIEIRD